MQSRIERLPSAYLSKVPVIQMCETSTGMNFDDIIVGSASIRSTGQEKPYLCLEYPMISKIIDPDN